MRGPAQDANREAIRTYLKIEISTFDDKEAVIANPSLRQDKLREDLVLLLNQPLKERSPRATALAMTEK